MNVCQAMQCHSKHTNNTTHDTHFNFHFVWKGSYIFSIRGRSLQCCKIGKENIYHHCRFYFSRHKLNFDFDWEIKFLIIYIKYFAVKSHIFITLRVWRLPDCDSSASSLERASQVYLLFWMGKRNRMTDPHTLQAAWTTIVLRNKK